MNLTGRQRRALLLALVLGVIPAQFPVWGRMQVAWVARDNGGASRITNQVVALQLAPDGNIVVAGSSTGAAGEDANGGPIQTSHDPKLVLPHAPEAPHDGVSEFRANPAA